MPTKFGTQRNDCLGCSSAAAEQAMWQIKTIKKQTHEIICLTKTNNQ